ncbi:hypothetical protein Hanom_Chr05g00404511 [Helianthus anomalus]
MNHNMSHCVQAYHHVFARLLNLLSLDNKARTITRKIVFYDLLYRKSNTS